MVFDVDIATRGAEFFCRRHLPPEMHEGMIRKLHPNPYGIKLSRA